MKKRFVACLLFFAIIGPIGIETGLAQPAIETEGPVELHLGNISFRIQEVDSTPHPFRFVELNIEVFNRDKKGTAPPNSVRVVVTQKELKFSGPKPAEAFSPSPQEAILNTALPPLTGRVLIIGSPLPREKIESITFEIHLDPPKGEQKPFTVHF